MERCAAPREPLLFSAGGAGLGAAAFALRLGACCRQHRAARAGRAQLEDLVTQRSGPLEFQLFRRLEHFGFKRAQIFLGVVGGFVAADGAAERCFVPGFLPRFRGESLS